MCYCCRKLDFETFSGKFVRPCEAVGGRAPLIGLEICLSQSGVPGLTRPHTASQIRPHTASHGLSSPRPHTICHVICLSQSEESTASHAHGLPQPLTHSGRESDPWGYLTDFTAKRIASLGRVQSASHAHRPRVRSSGLSDWFHG